MRSFIIATIVTTIGTTAFAQVPSDVQFGSVTTAANHPGHAVAPETGMTELQREAERVDLYRRSTGRPVTPTYQNRSPASSTQSRQPVAPNGLSEMSLYERPEFEPPTRTPANVQVHSVVKGDTLYNISKRYDVTVGDLRGANSLPDNTIKLGTSLVIPAVRKMSLNQRRIMRSHETRQNTAKTTDASSSRPIIYAVAFDDTLSIISRRTCVSADTLMAYNNIQTPDALSPGMRLSLPRGHCLAR